MISSVQKIAVGPTEAVTVIWESRSMAATENSTMSNMRKAGRPGGAAAGVELIVTSSRSSLSGAAAGAAVPKVY
ncbi:hypothetical protein Cde04nite_32630 [Cellulomonas denverensis]|nr:hypothetical protein Cde04nite_32630 [Cellulomonas denverensis]